MHSHAERGNDHVGSGSLIDRSHAQQRNAAWDAPRPAAGARLEFCALVTQSVTGCIPTQSVGTIMWDLALLLIVPHAQQRNAAWDAPRPAAGARLESCVLVTRSVTGCIPTQSVGMIMWGLALDRSHAQQRNAAWDAPRPAAGARLESCALVTQSVTGCIPLLRVGTIICFYFSQSAFGINRPWLPL